MGEQNNNSLQWVSGGYEESEGDNIETINSREGSGNRGEKEFPEDIENRLYYHVAGKMYESAKLRAGGMFDIYAGLDYIRPYFDVDLQTVLQRLLDSLYPRKSSALLDSGKPDLYGPVMLLFTLIAILLYGMKMSHVKIEEGTLMGSAFALCWMYWIVIALAYRAGAYICSMPLTFLEALSLTGYGFFGYCLALLFQCLLPDTYFSFFALIILGGLSSFNLALLFYSHIADKTHGIVVALSIFMLHLLFLLYLRYYYAAIYSAVTEVTADVVQVVGTTVADVKIN